MTCKYYKLYIFSAIGAYTDYCPYCFQTEYRCTFPGCNTTVKTRQGFLYHVQRHQGIYPYRCPYCNKGMNGTSHVKEHITKHHTGLVGYHCNKCRQDFRSVRDLKIHLDENSCSGGYAGNMA